ncbi:EF-hand domain-containing protein [Mariniblastus sp.]|nr:EF-hand domain-containing protein [Mariniblastus sp.]
MRLAAKEGQTIAEFKKHVEDRFPEISEEQLEMIAEAVDRDGDGTISDEEFENRMESIQAAFADAE